MQTDTSAPKGIATKKMMKMWFQRGEQMVSPDMEFLGDEWYFVVDQDAGSNLLVAVYRACYLETLPTNITYEIRLLKTNDEYISLHGVISELTAAEFHLVPSQKRLNFPILQNYFNPKGKMMIELDLSVKEQAEKLSAGNSNLFSENSPFPYDCSFLVEENKICVDRRFLSMHSACFKAMFESGFKEKEQAEIELKDLDFNEFIELLSVVYPLGELISVSNVECLLKLADRFGMLDILKRCEQFLLLESNMENFKKLLLAQRYCLMDLKKRCASQYQHLEDIKQLKSEADYDLLDETTKSVLFDNLARAIRYH